MPRAWSACAAPRIQTNCSPRSLRSRFYRRNARATPRPRPSISTSASWPKAKRCSRRRLLTRAKPCSPGACPNPWGNQEEWSAVPPGSMNDLFAFLSQLMTEHASLFVTMGAQMFRGFAVILISWYGIKSALSAASGSPMTVFHFDKFASLLITIAFGYAMITYYSQPIPGLGISFYHLIVDQGLDLSNQLNHSLVQEVWDRLNNLYFGLEMPAVSMLLNVMEVI